MILHSKQSSPDSNKNKKKSNATFFIEDFALHESWKQAWPKIIARAWYIEKLLKWEIEQNGEEGEEYRKLRNIIPDSLEKDISCLKNFTTEYINEVKINIDINKINKGHGEKIIYLCELLFGKLAKVKSGTIQSYIDKGTIENLDLVYYFRHVLANDIEYTPQTEQLDDKDFQWYKKLLSHNSEMVMDALMEEGFVIDAGMNISADSVHHLASKVIVRQPNQKYEVNPNKEKAYYKKTNERIERVVVSYTPEGAGKKEHDHYFTGSRENGWENPEELNHVLILTLPPAPEDRSMALAVSDYEAAGKVYPFCLC